MGPPCTRRRKKKRKNEEEELDSDCSTPKAERYQIPEMKTCPPAPKKSRRMLFPPPSPANYKRTPHQIPFFLSPDIDLFFYFALRGTAIPPL